jgi:Rps23 Pro-64 3,4-dihydroxylase Tpa1-like proline 4-hydroxylase
VRLLGLAHCAKTRDHGGEEGERLFVARRRSLKHAYDLLNRGDDIVAKYFPHLVWDDALPEALHDRILEFVLANDDQFAPSLFYGAKRALQLDPQYRSSLSSKVGLGPLEAAFKEVIGSRFEEMLRSLQLVRFEMGKLEIELVAYQHGAHFLPHIDTAATRTESSRNTRMITTVYYFHSRPKRFQGGEIALFPLGRGEPILIEPCDNRLIAFASYVPHEVKLVTCGSEAFSSARFAVNCWLHRDQPPPPKTPSSSGVHFH